MKPDFNGKVRFSFQPKWFTRFTWIGLIWLCFAAAGFAADDVQQGSVLDSKQLIREAEKLTRRGYFIDAEKLLRQAIAQDGNDPKARLSLGFVLLKQRRFADTYSIGYDIAQNDRKNSRAYALVGMSLLNFGKFKDARGVFAEAIRLDQREFLAWAGLGMLDFYENRIEDGIEKLRISEYLEPNDPDVVFGLAQALARAERYKEAAESYNRFLVVAPRSDDDRRSRIKGLIEFLRYLGERSELYRQSGDVKKTTIPLEMYRDRPILEIKVNGKDEKLRFVLDTGSGITVMSAATAERLKIKPISKGGMARAVGGDGKFEIVYGFLKNIQLGEAKIGNVPIYIRKFHDDVEKIDGYIGLSLISKFLTTVDYGSSTMTLTKKNKDRRQNPGMESAGLPLRLTSSGFLSGEVQLDGIEMPLNFIVDTGASISVISSALANTDEISRFSIEEKMRVVGAAGITENVGSYLIPKVSFGEHTRADVKAIALNLDLINEASGFEQAGILGGNFLKNYCLTFDFQNSKVTFVPIKK